MGTACTCNLDDYTVLPYVKVVQRDDPKAAFNSDFAMDMSLLR